MPAKPSSEARWAFCLELDVEFQVGRRPLPIVRVKRAA